MSITVSIRGTNKFVAKLDKVSKWKSLNKPMDDSLKGLQDDMAVYPPKLPNQRYIRTFRLKKGWTQGERKISVKRNGISGRIKNPTSYGPFVQGHGFQARIHRGRWQTELETLRKATKDIVRRFDKALGDKARS